MSIVNVMHKITDFDGKELPGSKQVIDKNGNFVFLKNSKGQFLLNASDEKIHEMEPLTYKEAMINSLCAQFNDEQNLTGKKRFERYQIAQKIAESNEKVELSTEEIMEIKLVVGKFYLPIVVGKVYDMLEGRNLGGKK